MSEFLDLELYSWIIKSIITACMNYINLQLTTMHAWIKASAAASLSIIFHEQMLLGGYIMVWDACSRSIQLYKWFYVFEQLDLARAYNNPVDS